jgi:prevent-host-death family protein
VRSTGCYDQVVTERISQRELRNDSGRIMRALAEGQTFVVTSHGRPVGELRPLRRDRFVDAVTAVEVFRHAPPLDWDRVREDIDRYLDQEIAPRA